MYCKSCGTKAEENIKFCPICGESMETEAQPVASEVNNGPLFSDMDVNRSINQMQASSNDNRGAAPLALGILSVVFSALNYMGVYYVHMVGIVLGIIAISIASKLIRFNVKNARAGLVLGIIGLSLGGIALIVGALLAS